MGFDRDERGCAYRDPEERRLGDISLMWTRKTVTPELKDFLRSLKPEIRFETDGKRFRLVHGSPRRMNEYLFSARAAETLWPDEDPIGKPFTRGDRRERFEVVGVVVDGHPTALDAQAPLMVYVPYWYNNEGKSVLVARTEGDPGSSITALRAAVRAVDPEIAIGETAPLADVVDKAVSGRRYQTTLFVAFAVVALLIAATGVYAATAYGVSRRRREMNIRIALGAPIVDVFALVLRQSAVPLAVGVAAGCVGALAMSTVVAGLLFKFWYIAHEVRLMPQQPFLRSLPKQQMVLVASLVISQRLVCVVEVLIEGRHLSAAHVSIPRRPQHGESLARPAEGRARHRD